MAKRMLFAIISVLSLTATIAPVSSFSVQNDEIVCLTAGCVDAAAEALKRMDLSVDPCDDFYNFACGKFIKENKIPDDKNRVDTFADINDKVQEQLRLVVGEDIGANDLAPFAAAKKLYSTCMNETSIEKDGKETLTNLLDKLGGWPVVEGDRWNQESRWTWIKATSDLRKIGYGTDDILSVSVQSDLKNSTVRTIYVGPAALGLSSERLIKGFDNDIVKAYYKYMVDMAAMFGANRTRAEQELKESLEFEIKLAKISPTKEEQRNYSAMYNPFTLREVQEKYPYIQWVDYINALLPSPLTVDGNEVVVVSTPNYFKNLSSLLMDTPPRVIANHIMWHFTQYSAAFLTKDLRKIQTDFSAVISGQQTQTPRWKECLAMSKSLSIAVSAMYVRKYFQENAKAAASKMVEQIRAEFDVMLKEIDWMDDETRQIALKKLGTMSVFIGYADEYMKDSKIENFYKNLTINDKNLLSFILSINVFDTDRSYNQLREPVDKKDWLSRISPYIVNAFYAPNSNGIQFPAAILQGQFFSANRPRFMNFGAIGTAIGHEVTHGFDDQGRQFDLDGNLVDWWQPQTTSNFLKRAKCIIEQYGNYTEPSTGLKLNGVVMQGENIADNGGYKEAYLAYRRWHDENGPEPKLPGLNLTPLQMFWVSAAQNWCSVVRPESLAQQILSDPHPPNRFRVLGPLRNRKEFASDFQCPEGSPMNPVKKCEVW